MPSLANEADSVDLGHPCAQLAQRDERIVHLAGWEALSFESLADNFVGKRVGIDAPPSCLGHKIAVGRRAKANRVRPRCHTAEVYGRQKAERAQARVGAC